METQKLATLLSKLQSIAQTGKKYGKDPFDLERYDEMNQVTKQLLQQLLPAINDEKIQFYMENDEGYATPKVDIRAIVFDHKSQLLLVQEKSDHKWALPGGWGDIGYSPFEVAQKETFEEAGIIVKAQRLLAVKDKAKHPYPASLTYTYKMFIVCQAKTVQIREGLETSKVGFFSRKQVSQLILSENRTLREDIELAFLDHENPQAVSCD